MSNHMSNNRTRVLYGTDLTYQAQGRRYSDEDIYLSAQLREHFDIALCHPEDMAALMDDFDVVVVRNTGPVIHYQAAYDSFCAAAKERGVKVFTELSGQADMVGKQYLVDLSSKGYPVIPTIDSATNIDALPQVEEYVAKPKFGADSVGLQFVQHDQLSELTWDELLVQPRIDFQYEVSFYFVDRVFIYALNAPDRSKRWELRPYAPSKEDLRFAQQFIDWNAIDHGIQRVDACRTQDGDLLLVELEDLNPYLSLSQIDEATRKTFINAMTSSIATLASKK